MKRTSLTIFKGFLVLALCLCAGFPIKVEAARSTATVALAGTYYTDSKENILKYLNDIRYEACAEGVRDPRNSSRSLTLADYVPLKWSSYAETYARSRAAESSIYLTHNRLNGMSALEGIYSLMDGIGAVSAGENIACYGNLYEGIDYWYAEKYHWVNYTGGVTGHYTNIINPQFTHVGISGFTCTQNSTGSDIVVVANFLKMNHEIDETKDDSAGAMAGTFEALTSYLSSFSINGASDMALGDGALYRLSNMTITTPYGNYFSGTYTVSPAGSLSWVSSDERVLTVDADGYVKAVGAGSATITCYNGSMSASKTISVIANEIPAQGQSMYRLYNAYSGEHFYTASMEERDFLIVAGWNYEGIAWYAPETSEIPVYRLYNPNAGDHHYTYSEEERDNLVAVGWNYEGVGWYSAQLGGENSIPLFRLYNPNAKAGAHHYTTSVTERNFLIKQGWHDEQIAWYGLQ